MTVPSPSLLLIILAGAVVGGALLLLVMALIPREEPVEMKAPSPALEALRRAGMRVPIAVGVGLLVLLLTRWPVASVATGVLVFAWPALFGGAGAETKAIARLEGLAAWTESLRDMVTTVFETNLSLQDARLNTVMKKLTGWAAIIAVPTAITGFYGQNVEYPGINTVGGFLTSTALIVLIVLTLYWMFRRRDWL